MIGEWQLLPFWNADDHQLHLDWLNDCVHWTTNSSMNETVETTGTYIDDLLSQRPVFFDKLCNFLELERKYDNLMILPMERDPEMTALAVLTTFEFMVEEEKKNVKRRRKDLVRLISKENMTERVLAYQRGQVEVELKDLPGDMLQEKRTLQMAAQRERNEWQKLSLNNTRKMAPAKELVRRKKEDLQRRLASLYYKTLDEVV